MVDPRAAQKVQPELSRFSIGDVPVFADIDDIDSVYRLIMDLREKDLGGSISMRDLTYNS